MSNLLSSRFTIILSYLIKSTCLYSRLITASMITVSAVNLYTSITTWMAFTWKI